MTAIPPVRYSVDSPCQRPPLPDHSSDLLSLPRLTRVGRRVLPLVAHILREDADLLTRWRARLTAAFLSAVATLGLLVAVPMVSVAVARGLWLLVFFDISALIGTYALLFSHRVSNSVRTIFLTGASFGLGVVSVVTRGPGSTVLGWLFMSVFLAAFLLGPRATALVVTATLGVLGGVAVAIAHAWVPWANDYPSALSEWLLTSLNFTFLIVVFAVANGIIIRLLVNEDRARTLAEQRLREARHHEALGTLAGGIAHDFNNLLVPIMANVESVRSVLVAGSDTDSALRDAQRSAERAGELVQRILTFGRGLETPRVALDPVSAAHDAVQFSRLSAPAGVHITLSATSAPPVWASSAELHQLFANLMTNAIHAVGEGGQVEISVDTCDVNDRLWVRVRVSDNGAGMDAHTRERLFDPYFSTKGPGRGTGLGLPIVQSVVRSLGGQLDVESTLHVGTAFTVRLPALEVAAPTGVSFARARSETTPQGDAPLETAAVGAGTHVLLVDDEPSVRRAASRVLDSLGCVVTSAASAEEALRYLERPITPVDVLVTDYRMPGGSGLDLIRAVQRLPVRPPVVLVSGHLEAASNAGDLIEGVVLLAKPFTRSAMAEAIAVAIRGAELPR